MNRQALQNFCKKLHYSHMVVSVEVEWRYYTFSFSGTPPVFPRFLIFFQKTKTGSI
jgi:hypothetical protein